MKMTWSENSLMALIRAQKTRAAAVVALCIKGMGALLTIAIFTLAARAMTPDEFGQLAIWFNAMSFLAVAAVCFYIGYFGAGAGFLLITVLSLFGYEDLHEINALKVVTTTLANGIAFIIFVVNGQVVWRYCLLAMVTCAVGGYTSARFARMVPQFVLRGLVIFIGFSMAAWFFWSNR